MKVRRGYILLALLGGLLWAGDVAQRWVYLHRLPQVSARQVQGHGSLTRAVLVAGQGLDGAETATSVRDVAAASRRLRAVTAGQVEVESLLPGGDGYGTARALEAVASSRCDHLVVYLTGHGGGRNFGAVGGLNLRREAFVQALTQASFSRATVVIDCCWSGEFGRSLEGAAFPGPVTLVTSTDAHHPSPFPVSFLSPWSYGRGFFELWDGGEASEAFAATNASRRRLRWLFSPEFGLEGELRESKPGPVSVGSGSRESAR